MKTNYLCSHCNHSINVGEDIVLVAKNDNGEKGLIFLHSELGNYSSKFSNGIIINKGDLVKLSCPVCHNNLTNLKNDRLANFIMVDENDKKFDIVISQIYGENCTYKIEEQKVTETFGEHWSLYQTPDWFQFY